MNSNSLQLVGSVMMVIGALFFLNSTLESNNQKMRRCLVIALILIIVGLLLWIGSAIHFAPII